MAKDTVSYNVWLEGKLADPHRAARYLNRAQEESPAAFLKALRKVAAAQSRPMKELAEAVGVNRESLYRMMDETGNPTYGNLLGMLSAMGLRIRIEPIAERRNTD